MNFSGGAATSKRSLRKVFRLFKIMNLTRKTKADYAIMKSEKTGNAHLHITAFFCNVCALRGQCWRTLTGFWPVTTSGGRKKPSS